MNLIKTNFRNRLGQGTVNAMIAVLHGQMTQTRLYCFLSANYSDTKCNNCQFTLCQIESYSNSDKSNSSTT